MSASMKIIVWEEDGAWLGYLQDYPEHWTQGDTLDDLRDHLQSLYRDLAGGQDPPMRRAADLVIA